MKMISRHLAHKESWLRESHDPAVIDGAGRGGNALTIWHREPEHDLKAAVDTLPDAVLPDERWSGSLPGFAAWVDEILRRVPAQDRGAFAAIADDVLELARWFGRRLAAPEYTFRFHRLADTMCPRFHTDYGPMRLLCTYRGPGTEWVPEGAVDRRALRSVGTENAAIVPDPERVRRLPRFAAAVLCGCDRSGHGGVVHRSPAVPAGTSRFAFCATLGRR